MDQPLSKERREEIQRFFFDGEARGIVLDLLGAERFWRETVKTAHATHCHSVCDGIDAACSFCGAVDETGDPIEHRPGCAWVHANE